jgi:hypothetical protein
VDLVEFSFKQRCFVPLPPPSHFLTLLDIESTCLHRETKEAQEQLARTYIPPVSKYFSGKLLFYKLNIINNIESLYDSVERF